jgi:hypothetical protein
LQKLQTIPINSKEECISALNESIIKDKILSSLPLDDKNDLSVEVGTTIIKLLIELSKKLFNINNSKEEKDQFKSKFFEHDGYNVLLFLLNIYENTELKLLTAVILARFSYYYAIAEEEKIIIRILINYLKDYVGGGGGLNRNENTEDENMSDVLGGLIIVSLDDKNKESLVDMGIIPVLISIIKTETSGIGVLKDKFCLLSNICYVESVEYKNLIIHLNVFDIFYEKLSELFPSHAKRITFGNYYLVHHIVRAIEKLLISNISGVESFLKTPLVPVMLRAFNSSITMVNTTTACNKKTIVNIISCIFKCFSKCCNTYEDACVLVENGVIDSMMKVIDGYVLEIKEKKNNSEKNIIKNALSLIQDLSNVMCKGERNEYRNYFDENDELTRLNNALKVLGPDPLVPKEINGMLNSIHKLWKRKREEEESYVVLEDNNNNLKLPPVSSGHDFDELWKRKSEERESCIVLEDLDNDLKLPPVSSGHDFDYRSELRTPLVSGHGRRRDLERCGGFFFFFFFLKKKREVKNGL